MNQPIVKGSDKINISYDPHPIDIDVANALDDLAIAADKVASIISDRQKSYYKAIASTTRIQAKLYRGDYE